MKYSVNNGLGCNGSDEYQVQVALKEILFDAHNSGPVGAVYDCLSVKTRQLDFESEGLASLVEPVFREKYPPCRDPLYPPRQESWRTNRVYYSHTVRSGFLTRRGHEHDEKCVSGWITKCVPTRRVIDLFESPNGVVRRKLATEFTGPIACDVTMLVGWSTNRFFFRAPSGDLMTTYIGIFSRRHFPKDLGRVGVFVAHNFRQDDGPHRERQALYYPLSSAAEAASEEVLENVLTTLTRSHDWMHPERDPDQKFDGFDLEILQPRIAMQDSIAALQAEAAAARRNGQGTLEPEKKLAKLQKQLSGMRLDNLPPRPQPAAPPPVQRSVHDLIFRRK